MPVNQPLTCRIAGLGAWGQNFRNVADLQTLLSGGEFIDDGAKGPKPEIIPANERRRAPLPVRLAVESSWQATQSSSYAAEDLSCVFVSSLGDTQLTDYMCRVLASENKQLSPTKFHNSVHNAAAGYWTISTGCMKAANSIAGYEESVALTLLEAMTQLQCEQTPILLTFYDAPVSPVLKSLLKNEQAFAVSVILEPVLELASKSVQEPKQTKPTSVNRLNTMLTAEVVNKAAKWPELAVPSLQALYTDNPTAKILALLSSLSEASALHNKQQTVDMPLSAESCLRVSWV